MRRGKKWRQLLPYALAPDFLFYRGLPAFVFPNIRLLIGGGFAYDFNGTPDASFVEIEPKTWIVTYHGKVTAGLYTIDYTLKVFPNSAEPGLRFICEGILDDGSFFIVEKVKDYFSSTDGIKDTIAGFDPWRSEAYRGIISKIQHVIMFPALYKQYAPSDV